ncbi:MAG: DUF4838 domain-containing protein [Lentisphaeria bacterium]|nr:DUF4838 domain-containing protein [Lentisphaeria bacterium]
MKIKSFLLAGFAAASLAAFADVELKNALIVHPDTMKGWEPLAVGDLKTALEKMTGREYRAVPESKAPASGVKIYVGRTRAAAKAGIDFKKMEPQQFRMKAGDGKVFLIGGAPTGTSYAVTTFLQTQFGVYCLAADCQIYPKNASPKVKDLDKTQKPDVTDRTIYDVLDRIFEPATQKKWHEFNRLNRMRWANEDRTTPCARWSSIIRRAHTFYQYLPPKKYFKDHPEYYSMRENGQRDWQGRGNLCLTNREVWKVTLKELLAVIQKERKKYPDNPPTVYAVAAEDNPGPLCYCPECKKRAEERGSYFCLVADYVNFLAREVRKVYPDVWIGTGANRTSDQPEANFELEKNVIFTYADRTAHSNSLYPLNDPMNREGLENLMKWRSKVPLMKLWDYFWVPDCDQPMVAVDAIIADCRLFRDLKLYSLFKESEFQFGRSTFHSFHLLQVFLDRQLLFDASQDPEKLICDFIDGYYGAAAPEMKEYLAMLRKAQMEKRTSLEEWTRRDHRNFAHVTPDFLAQARALVKKGLEKVRDDKQFAARVSWELLTIDHASFRYFRGVPGKEAEFKELQEEYKQAYLLNLETWHLKPAVEEKARQHLEMEFASGGNGFSDLPPELAGLPASDLIPVPSKYLKGHPPANVRGTVDPESSQPKAMVKRPLGNKIGKLLPVPIGVNCPISHNKASARIKKAPADEKYHWYRIGVISIDSGAYIHASWAPKLLLKDFYTATPGADGKDPNKYEVWISIRFQGPGYVPGSQKETGMFVDRGLLVRKP